MKHMIFEKTDNDWMIKVTHQNNEFVDVVAKLEQIETYTDRYMYALHNSPPGDITAYMETLRDKILKDYQMLISARDAGVLAQNYVERLGRYITKYRPETLFYENSIE